MLIKCLAFMSTQLTFSNILGKLIYFKRFDSKYSNLKSQLIGTTETYTYKLTFPSRAPQI